ncbi:hypothetical protein ACMYSQ_012609 [Aspergillus niger]
MSASSALLHANILLFPDRAHIYRRWTASPNFAQSFAIHLAAFASLDQRARGKVIENAPDVLSCTVNTAGLITQSETPASTSAYSADVYSKNFTEQCSDGSLPLSPPGPNFPYDVDFTRWLHFDDQDGEQMDVDTNEENAITSDNSAPHTNIVDLQGFTPSQATDNQDITSADSKMSEPAKQYPDVDGVKRVLEDCLEDMHSKLVETGDMDTPLGKAFACIFDNPPTINEADEKSPTSPNADPVSRFFSIVCKKLSLFSSSLTSKTIQATAALNLARVCCEWVLLETLCYTRLGIVVHRPWLAAPAQEVYVVSREGVENLQPLPINGAKPWKSLRRVDLAPLGSWTLRLGDIVNVDTGHSTAPAKVSDLRSLDDGRFVVVYCWLYTREDIIDELKIDGAVPSSALANLNQMWPPGVRYNYMLSTNRTITIWDTAVERVSPESSFNLCYSAIYSTTPTSRRIWSIENKRFQWMKKILHHEPEETAS